MSKWIDICERDEIVAGTGVCAQLGDEQVAVFRCRVSDKLYAVSIYDPIGGANVLSRGIMGCVDGETVVASPLYKQHFSLSSGKCLQQPEHQLKTYSVRADSGRVQLATEP